MKNTEVIKFVVIFLLVGFALYRKYVMKASDGKKGKDQGTGGSRSGGTWGDDDYEPYSGK